MRQQKLRLEAGVKRLGFVDDSYYDNNGVNMRKKRRRRGRGRRETKKWRRRHSFGLF
jgi:hypothetical protein